MEALCSASNIETGKMKSAVRMQQGERMRVILRQDIKGIGKQDDIVNVSPGYARNYLFPRNLAFEADKASLAELKRKHDAIEKKGEKVLEEAKAVQEKLVEKTITVQAKGGTGTKLYGSVTAQDIADAIKEQTGVEVDKRKIHIADPIKTSGSHVVPMRLHRDVGFDLTVEVVTQ